MKSIVFLILLLSSAYTLTSCSTSLQESSSALSTYFASDDSGIRSGGVKTITIDTPQGKFKVWTKRFGNNPTTKVLLLHGGPGGTHEVFECFESFLPQEGIEFIYYDQLGSAFSDQPADSTLWDLPRFVEEVEQVRVALGLNKDNFYLFGQSWGGILAMQYALKYQQNLKGLIVSNMMASCPRYGEYAQNVLSKQMKPEVLREIQALEASGDFDNPRYMELLIPNFYEQHLMRRPAAAWPNAVDRAFAHMNSAVYVPMQGPSEFGIAGKLANWDVSDQLSTIQTPTLVIGATHDTMDPEYMKWMATEFPNGAFLLCPNGSHLSQWDDQPHFFPGLIAFLKK